MKKIFLLMLVLMLGLCLLFVSCGKASEDDEDKIDSDEKGDKDEADGTDSDDDGKTEDNTVKYDYDMSTYISIPDYKSHTFDINEDEIKIAISAYLINYASEYSVNRGDKIQVDMKFYMPVDSVVDAKGEEIIELRQEGIWLQSVATPNANGDYQISSQLENALLNAKIGITVSKLLTLDDKFFDENYRNKKLFVDMTVKNKICEKGDVLTASYTGYFVDENGEIVKENGEDKTFDTSVNSPFFIGSHLAIDDFEKGLVGMTLGEEKDIYATFPNDYEAMPSLAGKRVLFKVKIKSYYTPPSYNDEFVKNYFNGFETVDEFEESLMKEYIREKVYDFIDKNAQALKYPSKEYEMANEQLEEVAKPFIEQYGMTVDEYIESNYSMTRDEYIKANMKTEMIFYALRHMIGTDAVPTETEIAIERQKLIDQYTRDYMMDEDLAQSQAKKKASEYVEALGENYIYENVMYSKIDEIIPNQVKTNLIPSEKEYVWEINK